MFFYLLQGITLGISAAATPGPFQAYLLSQSALKGWRKSLPAVFSPLLSDGPIIAVSLLLLSAVPVWLHNFLRLAGGFLLGFLAWQAFRAAYRGVENTASGHSEFSSMLKAAAINILNPNPYIFWTLIGAPVLLECWRKGLLHCIAFLGGLYCALIAGCAALVILVATAAGLEKKLHRGLLYFSAAALALYALWQLYTAGSGIAGRLL